VTGPLTHLRSAARADLDDGHYPAYANANTKKIDSKLLFALIYRPDPAKTQPGISTTITHNSVFICVYPWFS